MQWLKGGFVAQLKEYDAEENGIFWSRRPVLVARRLIEICAHACTAPQQPHACMSKLKRPRACSRWVWVVACTNLSRARARHVWPQLEAGAGWIALVVLPLASLRLQPDMALRRRHSSCARS